MHIYRDQIWPILLLAKLPGHLLKALHVSPTLELCKLSKRSEKKQSPEEIRLEQPGSMRLACVMESERADQVEFEGIQVRVYSANGKLEAEIAEREKAKNYKVIDVKKRLSETMNYDPSELQLSWGESNLEDDMNVNLTLLH